MPAGDAYTVFYIVNVDVFVGHSLKSSGANDCSTAPVWRVGDPQTGDDLQHVELGEPAIGLSWISTVSFHVFRRMHMNDEISKMIWTLFMKLTSTWVGR